MNHNPSTGGPAGRGRRWMMIGVVLALVVMTGIVAGSWAMVDRWWGGEAPVVLTPSADATPSTRVPAAPTAVNPTPFISATTRQTAKSTRGPVAPTPAPSGTGSPRRTGNGPDSPGGSGTGKNGR